MTERKPLPYVITAGILFYCLHWLAKLFEMSPDTAINDDFVWLVWSGWRNIGQKNFLSMSSLPLPH